MRVDHCCIRLITISAAVVVGLQSGCVERNRAYVGCRSRPIECPRRSTSLAGECAGASLVHILLRGGIDDRRICGCCRQRPGFCVGSVKSRQLEAPRQPACVRGGVSYGYLNGLARRVGRRCRYLNGSRATVLSVARSTISFTRSSGPARR